MTMKDDPPPAAGRNRGGVHHHIPPRAFPGDARDRGSMSFLTDGTFWPAGRLEGLRRNSFGSVANLR